MRFVMLQNMFLIAAAFLLLVLQNASATTTDSDTIWTKSLPYYIKGCAFSLTGDSIISIAGEGGGDSLFILDAATGKTLKNIKCKAWVWTYGGFVHFNTKSWVAIAIDADFGGLYIYDYLKDSIVNEKFGFLGKAIAITKDDKYIYVQNNSSSINNISIYDVEKGEVVDSISSGYGTAHSLAISPDNKYLAIGTGKLKRVYPPEYPYEEDRMFDKIVIINLEKKEVIKEFDGLSGTEGEIRELKFSPDGKYLGVAKLDGTVRVYDMINVELYRSFSVYGYSDFYGSWKITFTYDSKFILTGNNIPNKNEIFYYDIINNSIKYTYNTLAYITLEVLKNNYLLTSGATSLVFINPTITNIKDLIYNNNDTNNIVITKSINTSKIINFYNEIINEHKLFDVYGNELNTYNIIKNSNDNIFLDSKYLQCNVYYLYITTNKEYKIIKILVTE